VSATNIVSCRRKEEPQIEQMPQPKKPRLVFTDLQRRTLQAIFKVGINNPGSKIRWNFRSNHICNSNGIWRLAKFMWLV